MLVHCGRQKYVHASGLTGLPCNLLLRSLPIRGPSSRADVSLGATAYSRGVARRRWAPLLARARPSRGSRFPVIGVDAQSPALSGTFQALPSPVNLRGQIRGERNIFASVGHSLHMRADRVETDVQRFERLYKASFERVAAYLLARSDQVTAAEALSRTFEVAWRRRQDMPDEPLPWLLGVARRVLADERRGGHRRQALAERLQHNTPEPLQADHAMAFQERSALAPALEELTPVQREALLLIAWDGLSEREAAAALGCTRGALALRLHRARSHLRRQLSKQQWQAVHTDCPQDSGRAAGRSISSTEETV